MDCKIIRDLLPLYLDDVCSEESRRAVEAHLKDCETCRKIAADMGIEYQVYLTEDRQKNVHLDEGELFRKREKAIRKEIKLSIFDQIVLVDFVAVLLIALAAAGKFLQLYQLEEDVPVLYFMSYFWIYSIITVVGLALEIIFCIGRYILKKEMHGTRIWIGWFLGLQMITLVGVFFFTIVISINMPAEEILRLIDFLS